MATQFFGQFLLARGLLSRAQLLDAVEYQERQNLRLGDYAVKKGFITPADAARIHTAQTTRDIQFGEAAVELGFLARDQLKELLRAQQADHLYLGDCLTRLGVLSAEAVTKALAEYREDQRGQEGDVLRIPDDFPEVAFASEACELTRKMLLRLWGTPTKYGAATSGVAELKLPGTAASVDVRGDVVCRYIIGIPDELTLHAMRRLFGTVDTQSREDRIDLVSELANIVMGNLAGTFASMGQTIELSAPKLAPAQLRLEGEKALVLRLIAPLNELAIAITYASGFRV
ncbi:MAG: chemotaxis protein CheX [Myxococcota bacterium]